MDMDQATMERLYKPRSVFSPGGRLKMNIVPMFLNILVPWMLFVLCLGLTMFSAMYWRPALVASFIGAFFLMWLGSLGVALWARRKDPNPTWYSYSSMVVFLALVSGTLLGLKNFEKLSRPYYDLMQLKVIDNVDAGKERGQNMLDAGVINFAAGNKVDLAHSWHFKHNNVYCAAPIVTNMSGGPETHTYDFWAVGKDCCAVGASDFRCGPQQDAVTAGIRVLDEEALPFFRLAVQQAETLYNLRATHPIFLFWTHDPVHTINSWHKKVYRIFAVNCAVAFVVFLFLATLAVYKYAWIGRGPWSVKNPFMYHNHDFHPHQPSYGL